MTNHPKSTDIETSQDVRLFVGRFYTRIRDDEVLGVIFDEIAKVDWVDHIPTMCEFWETVLFQQPGYKGNPVQPHVELAWQMRPDGNGDNLGPQQFARWIRLFETTLDELFSGPRTKQAKRAANRMGAHMLSAIERVSDPFAVAAAPQPTARGYSFSRVSESRVSESRVSESPRTGR